MCASAAAGLFALVVMCIVLVPAVCKSHQVGCSSNKIQADQPHENAYSSVIKRSASTPQLGRNGSGDCRVKIEQTEQYEKQSHNANHEAKVIFCFHNVKS